jgi:hypothetical protein
MICQDLLLLSAINKNKYWHIFCDPDNIKFFILNS